MLMGQREYARHRGVSHTSVAKAIRQNRIRATPEGKIDSEQADRDWAKNTSQVNQRHHEAPAAAPGPQVGGPSYSQSRAVRETYMARLAKIEFETRSSKVMDKAEVQAMFASFGRAIRSAHENLPAQIAPMLAGVTDLDQIEAIVRKELRAVDESVAKEVLARFGQSAEEAA